VSTPDDLVVAAGHGVDSAAEIRCQFNGLVLAPLGAQMTAQLRTIKAIQHWSNWRRHHQGHARHSHHQHRLATELDP